MLERSTHLLAQAGLSVLRVPRFWAWAVAVMGVPPLLIQLLPVFPSAEGAVALLLAAWALPALATATVLALSTQSSHQLVHPHTSGAERYLTELMDHGMWQLGTLAGLTLGARLSGANLHLTAPALLGGALVLGAHLLPLHPRQTEVGPSLVVPAQVALGLGAAVALDPLARLGVPGLAWLCLLWAAGLLMRDPQARVFRWRTVGRRP